MYPKSKFCTADKQAAFDHVWAFITAQGRPSYDEETRTCVYDGPDGTHCAAGCLIKPGTVKDNGSGILLVHKEHPELFEPGCDLAFLADLQQCHDSSVGFGDFLFRFEGRMRNLARKYKLTVPA